ncbi:MAG: bifunctional diaminohydroxyphosphoribosylaminopyrimidine deaminase/5-amino-6-(5-phosphoribosylamino)uracil reductase RibD [Rhodospirillales bacterium]|nr:bifunctional diaminohydroxyphosphoribosylaminopyrimidine deaminase/5-amino-6-(5-phosphoribosylamino)uracil reductase RibD [Rhodospirillales bacterium]
MTAALGLARRGLGDVWPNPAVGCIIVRDGRVVGRGWTQPGGRPHAEPEALARAGDAARGGTAYVTLEPCAHHGKTPPCVESLLAAGIARVVAAAVDPDARVAGKGLDRLREAGVEVSVGLLGKEAAELNAGFFQRTLVGRPLVTLKTATTLDGRIATHAGESRWITGDGARQAAHRLRAESDAIMVGVGTAVADDPELTCRLPGLTARSPVRLVVDGHLRLPLTSRLVAAARQIPTWLLTLADADPLRREAFQSCGVELIDVTADHDGNPDLEMALRRLGERGLTRVLVEGGSHLAASLLRRDLVDRLAWFRAPRMFGGDGLPTAMPFGVNRLSDAPTFVRTSVRETASDLMETYRRA